MSSSFAFVPRIVSKSKKKTTQDVPSLHSVPTPFPHDPTPQRNGDIRTIAPPGTRGKVKCFDVDYANLIRIAVSDYTLWSDPELRRKVDYSGTSGAGEPTRDGFISLSYLLNSSKVLAPLQLQDSQTTIVKALRSYASDVFDVRLLVSEPSSSTWLGGGHNTEDVGGYEIRRKDWVGGPSSCTAELSKADWAKQTIYMENIPLQYRTIPGIARFVLSLLSTNNSPCSNHRTRLEDITLPPHHQDKLGDHPTCKGFALVVLRSPSDVEFLLQKWPWDRTSDHSQIKAAALAESPDDLEASKFGFRTLPKTRWEELREEYLAYRQQLVEEINAFEVAETLAHIPSTSSVARKPPETPSSAEVSQVDDATRIDPSSPYPVNSLVFVRNVHPETNKTTLRKFFAAAFVESLANGAVQGDGLDYVDFSKGMDSCYIRLATPDHAKILIKHFITHPVSQASGLDDVGVAPMDSNPMRVELVVGKREEFYWEKVPEKIRKQAVEKAIILMHTSSTMNIKNSGTNENGKKRKRKR